MNSRYYDLIKIGRYNIKSVKKADIKYPTSKHGIAYISRLENSNAFFDILYDIHTKEIIQIWFQPNIKNHGGYIYNNPDYSDYVKEVSKEIWVGRNQPIMISKSPVSINSTYEEDYHTFINNLTTGMGYYEGMKPVRTL